MFEKIKFKNKYPELTPYIKNKEQIKKILDNNKFNDYYKNNKNEIISIIKNLILIYKNNDISNIIIQIINNIPSYKLHNLNNTLSKLIHYAKIYGNKKVDILQDITLEEISNTNEYKVEEKIIDMYFKKYYTKKITVKNIDFLELYLNIQNIEIKKKLLQISIKDNLDFLAFIMNELYKHNINNNIFEEIFNQNINDELYNPEVKEKLGEENFTKLIKIYFSSKKSLYTIEIIDILLKNKEYETLKDLLHLNKPHNMYNISKDKQSFDFISLKPECKLEIIFNYITPKNTLYNAGIENLKNCMTDNEYEKFYKKHQKTIELFSYLKYENFKKLSLEEQVMLYKFSKNITEEKRNEISNEAKKTSDEIKQIYKKAYTNIFLSSKSIIEKASNITIEKITTKEELISIHKQNEYFDKVTNEEKKEIAKQEKQKILSNYGIQQNDEIKIYELKNEEPFSFLITVMQRNIRLNSQNMYNRPAHIKTINNPQNFCKDLPNGSEIISSTMINHQHINTFVGPYADIMYIFSNVEENDVISICHTDGAFPPTISPNTKLFPSTIPMSPTQLMIETMSERAYNEIAIRRKKQNGKKQLPTAILCYDYINIPSIIHAKYFNIPIIVIKTKTYRNISHFTENIKLNNSQKNR